MRPVWRSSRLPRGKGIRQVESPALRRGSRRSRASRRGRQAARSYGVRTYGPREARADVHAMRDACRKLAYIHHVAHLVVGSATRKMTFFPGHGQHTNKIPTERGEREESIGRMLCYHRHRTTIRIPHNRYCQDFFSPHPNQPSRPHASLLARPLLGRRRLIALGELARSKSPPKVRLLPPVGRVEHRPGVALLLIAVGVRRPLDPHGALWQRLLGLRALLDRAVRILGAAGMYLSASSLRVQWYTSASEPRRITYHARTGDCGARSTNMRAAVARASSHGPPPWGDAARVMLCQWQCQWHRARRHRCQFAK